MDNPGEPYATTGDILMDGSFYAKGSQTVVAAFTEFRIPLLQSAGAERRRAASIITTSPARPLRRRAGLSGSRSRSLPCAALSRAGFARPASPKAATAARPRAPSAWLIRSAADRGSPTARGLRPRLRRRALAGEPEPQARAFDQHDTVGFIAEPIPQIQLTADYFNITRTNEIISSNLVPENAVRGAQQPGTNYPGRCSTTTRRTSMPRARTPPASMPRFKGSLPLGRAGLLTAKMDGTLSHQVRPDHRWQRPTAIAGTVGPTALSGATGHAALARHGHARLDLDARLGRRHRQFPRPHERRRPVERRTCLQLNDPNPYCYIASFTYFDLYGAVPGDAAAAPHGDREQRHQPAAAAQHGDLWRDQLQPIARPGRRRRNVLPAGCELSLLSAFA